MKKLGKIISTDGTPIAFYQSGTGPPLVLVHGSGTANAMAWTAVIPALEEKFSLFSVDRRGRGKSGDHPAYALQREIEDLAAVVDSLEAPTDLLGHSFGALVVLEAALLTRNLRKLILYEPAIPLPEDPIYPHGVIDRMEALLSAGDLEGLLITLYRDVVKVTPHELEALRSSAYWPARVAAARNVPREARAEESYVFDELRFKDLSTPTLLLMGGESPAFLKKATESVDNALPDSRIAVLEGQQHTAMYTAPDQFLDAVVRFLLA